MASNDSGDPNKDQETNPEPMDVDNNADDDNNDNDNDNNDSNDNNDNGDNDNDDKSDGHSNTENDIEYFVIKENNNEDMDTQLILDNDTQFEEGEYVKVKIENCSAWLDARVNEVLPDNKYRIKLWRFTSYDHLMNNKYYRILSGHELRKRSRAPKKIRPNNTSETPDIIDLYLNGRDAQNELDIISKSIETFHNKNIRKLHEIDEYDPSLEIKFVTARFFAMVILEYLFAEEYHWRISCFWCDAYNGKRTTMKRATARSHIIKSGATCGPYDNEYSLVAFCDHCNYELHYDDITYRCYGGEHDICIKCLNNHKLIEYYKYEKLLQESVKFLDEYSVQCIVEYTVGGMRKFFPHKLNYNL